MLIITLLQSCKFTVEHLAVLHYMSQYYFCWDSVGMDILDLESVGMDPNCRAQHRASTSPPPPLAHFKHIELSVPKIKMESEMPNAKNQTIFCYCRRAEAHGVEYCEKTPQYSFLLIEV